MQPFDPNIVAIIGRHTRTTVVGITNFVCGVGEGQVSKWIGHSLGKCPRAAMGRQFQFG
jgi:hypothetical protein